MIVALTVGSPTWWSEGGRAMAPWRRATAQSSDSEQVAVAEPASAISADGIRTDTLVFATPDIDSAGDLTFVVTVAELDLSFSTTLPWSADRIAVVWSATRATA